MVSQEHEQLGSGCRLPVEIIDLIVRLIGEDQGYRTLASLARVNKHLCGQCQAILYHTVSNLDREFGGNPESLKRSPRLAKYVHTYIVQHSEFRLYLNTRKTDVAPLRPGPISKHLVNLKDLSVQLTHYSPNNFLMFKRIPFHLERFSWTECPGLSTLLDFLKTQPKLRRLRTDLYYERETMSFPPRYCPDLEYLEGSGTVIESIMPGRRISTLVWHEFAHLTALSILKLPDMSPFSFVSLKYFRNLKYLEVSYEEPSLLSILTSLPQLIGVIFPRYRGLTRGIGETRSASGTGEFFVACPLLRFVDIEYGRSGVKADFERWIPSTQRNEGVLEGMFISGGIEDSMQLRI